MKLTFNLWPGMLVRIIKQSRYKKDRGVVGKIGVVKSIDPHYNTITVEVEGMSNDGSTDGSFYFRPSDIEMVNDDEVRLVKGSRVRVCRYEYHFRNYKHNVIGEYGTVATDFLAHSSKVAVKLDRFKNDNMPTGDFYFNPSSLVIIDDLTDILEEKDMENNNITNYVNAVLIKFLDGKGPCGNYWYANFDPDLKVGDWCVAKLNDLHNFGVARVEEIVTDCTRPLIREIVSKIDTTAYDNRVKNRIRLKQVKEKMQERAKQLQDIALYQMLAKDDPDMMALLQEYQDIPKV